MHNVSHRRHKSGPREPRVMYIGFVPGEGMGIADDKLKSEFF